MGQAASCDPRLSLADTLRARIRRDGPMTVEAWMAACNEHYYATRDPFGPEGDFTTAPEISQMFGELIGLWLADLATRAAVDRVRLVELGPGRGTLMADLRRATRGVAALRDAPVHLVETSPALRRLQATAHPDARWHDRLDDVPADTPLFVVANEFFDALPVRQWLTPPPALRPAGEDACDERTISLYGDEFVADARPVGVEDSPERAALAATLGARLARQGGAALIVDYGFTGPSPGDTLQAVRGHRSTDAFADPGEVDLTAHVDFGSLGRAARPAVAHGPVPQGIWLERLGIAARAAALKARAPAAAAARIEAARHRLTAPAAMGLSFKVLALAAPGWPEPAGFA